MKIKKSIIVAIITTIGAIICALIAAKANHELETQNQNIQSQVANVEGNNNNVTINNVDDLVNEYNNLINKNEVLEAQNSKYFSDLTESNNKNKELESQLNEIPNIIYNNLSFSIDGLDKQINENQSMVTINGVNYYSEEILKKMIPEGKTLTINNDGIYIGRVVKEQTPLSNEWIVHSNQVGTNKNSKDSYGNVYSNALEFFNNTYIIYNLNNNYSFLRCKIAIREDAYINVSGVITIKADDIPIYTSPVVTKTTKPFEIVDIPINNCTLLEISYNCESWGACALSDIIVYN